MKAPPREPDSEADNRDDATGRVGSAYLRLHRLLDQKRVRDEAGAADTPDAGSRRPGQ